VKASHSHGRKSCCVPCSFAASLKSEASGIFAVLNPLSPRAYLQTGPAPVVKVLLLEYQPLIPIEGDWRKNHEKNANSCGAYVTPLRTTDGKEVPLNGSPFSRLF